MIINFEKSIPAWILLVCHFIFDIPIYWFFIALGVWILSIVIWMSIIGTATRLGNEPTPHRENKNPYSSKGDRSKNDPNKNEQK